MSSIVLSKFKLLVLEKFCSMDCAMRYQKGADASRENPIKLIIFVMEDHQLYAFLKNSVREQAMISIGDECLLDMGALDHLVWRHFAIMVMLCH